MIINHIPDCTPTLDSDGVAYDEVNIYAENLERNGRYHRARNGDGCELVSRDHQG
jgi:hypothetical protein